MRGTPRMTNASAALSDAAMTWTSTWFFPGTGVGTSPTASVSASP
jgi:hypothetical protein